MKISSKGRYAVRCLVNLLLTYDTGGEEVVPVSRISIQEGVSQNHIEQLFLRLKKKGILKSVRGRNGGYWLVRKPEEISVLEIIEAVEEDYAEADVGLKDSSQTDICASKYLWGFLSNSMKDMLGSISLQDLCEKARHDLGDDLSGRLDCR